jgi:hypothetical protein
MVNGTIPPSFALLNHLSNLNVAGTSITGTVSEDICVVHHGEVVINVNGTGLVCDCCVP